MGKGKDQHLGSWLSQEVFVDDLIAWALKQLDDDELLARNALHADAVRPGEWVTEHHHSRYHDEPNRCHIAEDRSGHYWSVAHEVFIPNAEHIARWDPARVLALTAALRGILDEFSWEGREVSIVRTLVEALYGDRPGYCEEWCP
jgi:hypothetical protein